MGKLRNRQRRDAVGRIKRRVLVRAIAERVLQIVVHAEAGANHGLLPERAPRQADARLRQELRVVRGEDELLPMLRLAGNDAVGKDVVGGAAMRFVPARGELVAEAEGERELGASSESRLARTTRRTASASSSPSARDRRGSCRCRRCRNVVKAGEGRLAVLAEGKRFVRLERLEPRAEAELVRAARPASRGLHRCRDCGRRSGCCHCCCPPGRSAPADSRPRCRPPPPRPPDRPARNPGTVAAGVPGVGSPVKK